MSPASADPLGFRSLLTGLPLAAWRQLRFGGWRMLLLYGILQGIVALVCAPLLRWLFGEALAAAGLHSVDMATIGGLLSTPLSLGLLGVILALALCVVSVQLLVLVLATRRVRLGEAITARAVAGDTARVLKKLFSPGSLALLWYLFLVLPLAQFGFLSVLTHAIAIPSFVSGELVKSVPGMIGYGAFLIVASVINARLALTLPVFALGNTGGLRSMRLSWRMTKKLDLPLQLSFALVMLLSGVAIAALVAASLAPTALTDLVAAELSPAVAAGSLALAQMLCLLLVGAAVVAFAAVLVELLSRTRAWLPADVELLELGSVPASAVEQKGSPGRRRAGLVALGSLLAGSVVLGLVNFPVLNALHVQPQTLVLGHRGFSGGGIENTISGLDAALAAGADLVEMDVMQTADGGLVAMHDAKLDRLAGRPLSVAELTLDEITQITVHDLQGRSDTIPSFRDYVLHAQKIGMPLLVEIKLHGQERPGFVDDVVAELESIDALQGNIYHSLSKPSIEQLKRLRPGLYTGYTMAFAGVAAPDTIADFIVVEEWSYNTELLASARAAGLGMYVWTVNGELQQRQMLRDEVDGIITDTPDLAVGSRTGMQGERGLAATLFDALMRFVVVI